MYAIRIHEDLMRDEFGDALMDHFGNDIGHCPRAWLLGPTRKEIQIANLYIGGEDLVHDLSESTDQYHEIVIALTPEAELWLMMNQPEGATEVQVHDPEAVRRWVVGWTTEWRT